MAEVHAFRVQDPGSRERWHISAARLTWGTVCAALIAVAATVVLFVFASAEGFVDRRVDLPSVLGIGPMSVASVAATAALATVAAGFLFGALAWRTRRPVRNFRVLATVFAVLSLLMPGTIAGPAIAMRLTMAGMHVIVWAVSLGVLALLATRPVRGAA